jgi:hypothetical protein
MTTTFPLAGIKPGQVVQTELTLDQLLAPDREAFCA